MNNSFISPGIDAQRMKDEAIKRQKRGEATTIHYHPHAVACTDNGGYEHEVFLPEKTPNATNQN